MSAANTARKVALDVLERIDSGAYANLALPAELGRSGLEQRDRSLVTELVYGSTRMRRACDWLVDVHLHQPVTDTRVRAALRLGSYQLAFTRIPAHAAVSATVEEAPARARGLVNAVLRRVSAGLPPVWPDLATELSYPDWIVDRLEADLGLDRARPCLVQMNEAPPVTTRADGYVQDSGSQWVAELVGARAGERVADLCAAPGGKATAMAAAVAGRDAAEPAPAEPAHAEPGRDAAEPGRDAAEPAHAEPGRDAAEPGRDAAEPALTEPAHAEPGRDAAEPALTEPAVQVGRLLVVAGDARAARARGMREGIRRLGLDPGARASVVTVVADGRQPPFAPGSFDRVLVDAPCSGLGVLRRRPDARWRAQAPDVERLAALQRALLASAAQLLRPGGTLAYSVCTLTRGETIEVDDWLTARHPELLPVPAPGPPWTAWGRGALLLPQAAGTDGMFLLRLTRGPGRLRSALA